MRNAFVAALAGLTAAAAVILFQRPKGDQSVPENFPAPQAVPSTNTPETATLAGGCFWCTEAVFLQLKGVQKVVSGYTGGTTPNPTYDDICTGRTGHAEAIQVTYDPSQVNFAELLEVFWRSHDPTTLNRQGADVGTQYRSAIFYANDKQREIAETYRKKIDEAGVYPAPIVTEIVPLGVFYPAEAYHQDYYRRNRNAGYCQVVIGPKLEKLRQLFGEKLK